MAMRRLLSALFIPTGTALLGVLFVIFWWVASLIWFIVPHPLAVWVRLVGDFRSGILQPNIWVSLRSIGIACVGSVALGVPLGVALGVSTYWRKTLEQAILSTNAIPKIILLPVVLAAFGIGPQSTAAMGIIIGVFPLLINTMAAVKNMKPVYIKVGRCFGFSPWQMLTRVYIPAIALPFVVGIRLAFSLSVVGVILTELFAAKNGLGQVVKQAYSLGVYDRMTGSVVLLFSFALAGSLLIWAVEKRLRRLA